MTRKRTASIRRETRETRVALDLGVDGTGKGEFRIGIPFLEHMLDQVARHGMLDLKIIAEGDLAVDAHHTVEDVGICLGQALREALGDKSGIRRFGHAYVPLDEALSRVVVDCSGRPGLEYHVEYPRARIGEFDVDLIREFFQAVVNHAGLTMHADTLRGRNAHHIAETLFKGFGRALRMALEADARLAGETPSTKGSL
ncbi:MAG: imidazoleglycerol-phosphate dehydratase [Gammaproteobacteria bacterium RIFCSPLOWO2_02_FULL_61_13]|nr:MAG: imidazoleglycerol-phosphate dehydratase [Gammaproteobacteria bacterium RIFCSPLOWO2_02_FULL_61_13]